MSGMLRVSESPFTLDTCEQLSEQLNKKLSVNDYQIVIDAWLTEDAADPGYQLLSDDDIVEQVVKQTFPEDSDNDDDGDEYPSEFDEIPKPGEVADMLEKCLLWYERQQESSTPTSALLLKQIRDLAITKRHASLKQMTLKSFITQQ